MRIWKSAGVDQFEPGEDDLIEREIERAAFNRRQELKSQRPETRMGRAAREAKEDAEKFVRENRARRAAADKAHAEFMRSANASLSSIDASLERARDTRYASIGERTADAVLSVLRRRGSLP